MVRAVALAARLGFTIERDTLEAIRFLRGEIVKSSPARLLEEIYKILRQGASRKTFEVLHEVGLLAYLLPEADDAIAEQPERLLGSLSRLDDYRNAGLAAPEDLSNAVVMGTLLVPLGISLRRASLPMARAARGELAEEAAPEPPEPTIDVAAEMAALGDGAGEEDGPSAALSLPFARRDLDRLRLILAAQSRLREVHGSPRVKHMLAGRGYLEDALRWMEIHGGVQGRELAAHWRGLSDEAADTLLDGVVPEVVDGGAPGDAPRRRRRRRRHRRRPRTVPPPPTA
jgi:poly(A) polymerase